MDKKIKKYSIHKLAFSMGYMERDGYGCYLGESPDGKNKYAFYDKNEDKVLLITLPKEISGKSIRKMPQETRELLKHAAQFCEKREKLEKEKDALEEKIKELNRKERPKIETKIKDSLGLLTKEAFAEEVIKNMPKDIRNQFETGAWEIGTVCGLGYRQNDLHFSREVDIQKWATPSQFPFLYEEYDRTLHFYSDYENDDNYKQLLSIYRKQLPIKAEFAETLTIGDKDWLGYSAMYSVPLKKDLTKDYAKEIADRLVNKEKDKGKASLGDKISSAEKKKKEEKIGSGRGQKKEYTK